MLDTWLRRIRVGWGERAVHSVGAISPVVARSQPGDLHMIGRQLATDGHQLDEVMSWFCLLGSHSRRLRRLLERDGIIDLAAGWAEGVLHPEFGAQSVTPFEVLRLRLHQQLELSHSLGEEQGAHLALVVIDFGGNPICGVRAIRHARDTFTAGETMAATPSGKLLVLVPLAQHSRRRTLSLIEALRHDDQLRSTPVRVWIEPLAMSAEHVDSHLLALAS